VYCWGSNDFGQIGAGAALASVPEPARVAGGERFTAISAGGETTCALNGAGKLFCWGRNANRAFGVPEPFVSSPVAVAPAMTWRSVSVGYSHLCGMSLEGVAYCWGRNTQGQLGIGRVDGEAHPAPEPVASPVRLASVVAATIHSCGLDAAGKAYCWGMNWQGVLTTDAAPVQPLPARAGGELAYVELMTGTTFVCGRTADARVSCWGDNTSGSFGTGDFAGGRDPRPAFGGAPLRVLALNSENTFAVHACATGSDDAARCWGTTTAGRLGGTPPAPTPCFSTATAITCDPVGTRVATHRFAALELGSSHSCGLTRERTVLCWGAGERGQLGNGALTNSPTPVTVRLPS
jgi:alpha-tubulin suppressor-like RCC1 family protein